MFGRVAVIPSSAAMLVTFCIGIFYFVEHIWHFVATAVISVIFYIIYKKTLKYLINSLCEFEKCEFNDGITYLVCKISSFSVFMFFIIFVAFIYFATSLSPIKVIFVGLAVFLMLKITNQQLGLLNNSIAEYNISTNNEITRVEKKSLLVYCCFFISIFMLLFLILPLIATMAGAIEFDRPIPHLVCGLIFMNLITSVIFFGSFLKSKIFVYKLCGYINFLISILFLLLIYIMDFFNLINIVSILSISE